MPEEEIKEKIIEILIEGFSTSPSRNWGLEVGTKEESDKGREENLKHIRELADELSGLFEEENQKRAEEIEVKLVRVFKDNCSQTSEELLEKFGEIIQKYYE